MEKYIRIFVLIIFIGVVSSCSEDFLNENPVDDMYAENLLVDYDGFESMNYALLAMVRGEYSRLDDEYVDGANYSSLPFAKSIFFSAGADNSWGNNRHSRAAFLSYPKNITTMIDNDSFLALFEWLYAVVNTSNVVITRAEDKDVDWGGSDEREALENKNYIIAQARLYRAWAYRHLIYSFGAVPLSTKEITGSNYRVDWERNSVDEIREVMVGDLLFAIDNLPLRFEDNNTKPNQAVARHYLGETYLAMGEDEKAMEILQPLVESSDFGLMTERFGNNADEDGNAFTDLFASPLYTEGNIEVLWAFLNSDPDELAYGTKKVFMRNMWQNYYSNLSDISGLEHSDYEGETVNLFWSLNNGKGAGRCAISIGAYSLYSYDDQQDNDYRYDDNAMTWHLYFLNEDDEIYEVTDDGESLIELKVTRKMKDDSDPSIKNYNLPSTKKWKWVDSTFEQSDEDGQYNDLPYLRLAETYFLYAEALFKQGDSGEAAEWINKIRRRANVSEISGSDVSIDFILDERSRELITEENRRHTLIRLSQEDGGDERSAANIFKTRVREYNEVSGRDGRGMDDDVTPVLFPIPLSFIESNSGNVIEQNPGY